MKEIKFKINGIQWYLEIVDMNDKGLKIEEGDYRVATIHYEEATIYVQEELFEADESLIRQVLIHEIVHAYQSSYGMLQIEWSEEIVADFIAAHIKSILRTYYEIMSEGNKEKRQEEFLDKTFKKMPIYKFEEGYEPKHMAEDFIEENMEHIPRID